MPDIDPAALSRADSLPNGPSTPSTASKPLIITTSSQKPAKAAPTAPRVDLEPLYTSLKSLIGENWPRYKDAVSQFILGQLSHAELTRQTSPFLHTDANLLHTHNALICGIHANIHRDAPDLPVAPWVSTNDKPAAVSKPVTGDKAKLRLKHEAMLLPRAARERIKAVADDTPSTAAGMAVGGAISSPLTHPLRLHTQAKRPYTLTTSTSTSISTPLTTTAAASSTATSSTSTSLNRDLEIRRRYNQSLASECHDLPSPSGLAERVLPICYEEGLAGGSANAVGCAELLGTAAELFIKEVLTGILSRTERRPLGTSSSPDAPLEKPSAKKTDSRPLIDGSGNGSHDTPKPNNLANSHTTTSKPHQSTNAPPTEPSQNQNQNQPLKGDLTISWSLTDPWLTSLTPWLGEQRLCNPENLLEAPSLTSSASSPYEHDLGFRDDGGEGWDDGGGVGKNGVVVLEPGGGEDGVGGGEGDDMGIDESSWHWQGASKSDRVQLERLLDDCLSLGR